MPLPRFRFTVRGMMVAVAVIALIIGAELTLRRVHHQRLARHYAVTEQLYQEQAKEIAEAINSGRTGLGPVLQQRQAMTDVAARLRRHWEQAARHPWLPVEPNPLSQISQK